MKNHDDRMQVVKTTINKIRSDINAKMIKKKHGPQKDRFSAGT